MSALQTPTENLVAEPLDSGELAINAQLVRRMLVGFIDNEVHRVGFERVVVGLSGGVDSSLSVALAAEALGADKVHAIGMPYKTSRAESLADAREVARTFGVQLSTVEITPQIDAYFERYPTASNQRRGNKMSRERMSILYDHSLEENALVIGTSNKTELLLGYGTIFGDMASALNPLGDLYKSQVWQLAAHVGVPEQVIRKAPTADLWEGQTDEAELGFGYAAVDRLLYHLVERRVSIGELVEMGHDREFVESVARRIRINQYKRRLPVIAKLSRRTIDRDFRYPRDWGV